MIVACSYPSPLAVVAPMLLGLAVVGHVSDRRFRSTLLEAAEVARRRSTRKRRSTR